MTERLLMRQVREILRLKYEQGLPHRAIARACGVGLGTVPAGPMAERWLSLSWWWACESRRGRSRRGSGRCSGPPFDGPPLRTGTSVTAEVFGDDGANLVRQRHFEFSEGYLARSCPKALSQFSR